MNSIFDGYTEEEAKKDAKENETSNSGSSSINNEEYLEKYDEFVDDYIKFLTSFAKVRMIGSAAVSILSVARGAAEAYFEKNIMIWDVAAGLAISEGAGGRNIIINTQIENSYDVMVSNYVLFDELKEIINE